MLFSRSMLHRKLIPNRCLRAAQCAAALVALAGAACRGASEGATGPVGSGSTRPGGAELLIHVLGLPAGVAADYSVTGQGLDTALTASAALKNLVSGTYIVTSRPTGGGNDKYLPILPRQSWQAIAGGPAIGVNVQYDSTRAELRVSVTGLVPGLAAGIQLTAPDNERFTVDSTDTLRLVPTGAYRIASPLVLFGKTDYVADSAPTRLDVPVGVTSLHFSYAERYELGIYITGLPIGSAAAVEVKGPGVDDTLLADTVLRGLLAGTYTFVVHDVETPLGRFRAAAPAPVTITDHGDSVSVAYAVIRHALQVNVLGLPASAPAGVVDVTLPDGTTRVLSASTTFTDVTPGTVSIVAHNASYGDSVVYAPNDTSATVTVQESDTLVTYTVDYSFSTGAYVFSYTNVPAGQVGDVNVHGTNYFRPDVFSQLQNRVRPGTYEYVPAWFGYVTDTTSEYRPDVDSSSFTISADHQVAHIAVNYHKVVPATVHIVGVGVPPWLSVQLLVWGGCPYQFSYHLGDVLYPVAPGTCYFSLPSPIADGDSAVYKPLPPTSYTLVVEEGADDTASFAISRTNLLEIDTPRIGSADFVTLTGPNGFVAHISDGWTGIDITPGTYTLTALPIPESTGGTLEPSVSTWTTTVTQYSVTKFTLTYTYYP